MFNSIYFPKQCHECPQLGIVQNTNLNRPVGILASIPYNKINAYFLDFKSFLIGMQQNKNEGRG
jgi:hypothetical protein